MRSSKTIGMFFILVGMLGVSGCAHTNSVTDDSKGVTNVTENTDPRNGWVDVQDSEFSSDRGWVTVAKICDGTSLLYVSDIRGSKEGGGIAVTPESPECQLH